MGLTLKDFGKTAFIYKGREIPYREVIENVGSFANLLSVMPDERVVIFSENRPEWVYSLFAIWRRGAIAVPVDFMSTPEEVAYILKDCTPKAGFCSNQTYERLKKAKDLAGIPLEIINFEEVPLPAPFEGVFHREAEDTALILYTSGTTGDPKGVMLTFKNLKSNIKGIAEAGIASSEDSTLAILPFHHSYPLMVTLLVPLHIGATVVFLDRLTPEDILEKLNTYRISILVGVPRLYNLLHRRIRERIEESTLAKLLFKLMEKIESKDLRKKVFKKAHEAFGGNLRFMVSGGAKLDLQVAKDLETLGFTVIEGYGLTETSPIVTFNPPEAVKLGSVGLPIKGVQVKISEEGEVLVKGPNVMKGYWNRPEETSKAIREGWLRTGDLGYMDEEGYLYITGRKKEIIVLGTGKNVNPEEIENLLLKESPVVKEAAVLELDGRLVALIVPDVDKATELKIVNLSEYLKWEVVDKVNRRLPEWKRITSFKVLKDELPKTRLGKLRRFLLPDIYRRAEEEKPKGAEAVPLGEKERSLLDFLEKLSGRKVSLQDHIELDLGLDSLAKVELLSFLERNFSLKLSEKDLAEHATVGSLVELVSRKGKGESTQDISWRDILLQGEDFLLHDHRNIFRLGRFLLKVFFKLYNRAQIEGAEKFGEKPFIIAPNHASYLDAFLLAALLPEKVAKDTYFLGEESYFRNPPARLFARLAHVVTVDIDRNLRESLQKVAVLLRKGKVVVIFPEGARTRTGLLMEFKKGTAILSKELNVPIYPVAIEGTYRALSIYDRFPKPAKIRVKVLDPVFPEGKDYETITHEVKERIAQALGLPSV